jgi:phosphonoacetaldehyde hydrolase
MDIKLVVFDWAGTLIDFGCCAPLIAFVEAFEIARLPITESVARKPMGSHKRDHIREILGYTEVAERVRNELGREPDETLVNEIYDIFSQRLPDVLPRCATPIPGAIETLEWLRVQQIAIGTTTGYVRSMMNVLEPVTNSLGIMPDAIVCSDEVVQSRPAPWACFRMAEKFGVYPMSQCLKIGDTPADMAEGRNASMITIGVSETGNEVGLDRATWLELNADERVARRTIAESKLRIAGAHDVLAGIHQLPAWIEEYGSIDT